MGHWSNVRVVKEIRSGFEKYLEKCRIWVTPAWVRLPVWPNILLADGVARSRLSEVFTSYTTANACHGERSDQQLLFVSVGDEYCRRALVLSLLCSIRQGNEFLTLTGQYLQLPPWSTK